MATAKDVLDDISQQLHGFGATSDRVTPLTADIGPSDSTFTVDFAFGQSVGIAPGVVEIDGEQLYVTKVDPSSGVCTLANGFGRGYNGTTPTAHVAGSKVTSRPRFPRVNLMRQVNQVIGALFPTLFTVRTYTTTVTFPLNTYTLSPVPKIVLDVQWQDPIGNWQRVHSYSLDAFDSTLRLARGPSPVGRPLRVVYGTEPGTFSAETDDFVTATGLPASCFDLVVIGAVARVLPGLDISRAQLTSVEQSDRGRIVPPNTGITVASYMERKFQERLANEAEALRRPYKARIRREFG